MSIQQRRQNLLLFIIESFSPNDLIRAKMDPDNQIDRLFKTYDDFRNHQINPFNVIDMNTFNFIEQLMLVIERGCM